MFYSGNLNWRTGHSIFLLITKSRKDNNEHFTNLFTGGKYFIKQYIGIFTRYCKIDK